MSTGPTMRQTDVLENAGYWFERQKLPGTPAPHHRTLENWTFFCKTANRELAQALKDPASWRPAQYDGDASL